MYLVRVKFLKGGKVYKGRITGIYGTMVKVLIDETEVEVTISARQLEFMI